MKIMKTDAGIGEGGSGLKGSGEISEETAEGIGTKEGGIVGARSLEGARSLGGPRVSKYALEAGERLGEVAGAKNFVGVVLGRKPATPVEFWVAVERDIPLQLDDAVFTETTIKDENTVRQVRFYGIVSQIEKSFEGLEFDSDMYHIKDIRFEERHVAHVKVTLIEPEYLIPPSPGAPVFLARGEEFAKAVGAERMTRKIPAGLSLTSDEIIYLDLGYIDGEKGAHINISGISGVATKTSYGLFLLHEIMREDAKKGPPKYSAIIFNVKGEDLLFLDKPNRVFYEKYWGDAEVWKKLSPDLYAEFIEKRRGFFSGGERGSSSFGLNFYAPPSKEKPDQPDVLQREKTETFVFGWNMYEFAKYGLLRYSIYETDSENIKGLMGIVSDLLHHLAERTKEKKKQEIDQTEPEIEYHINSILAGDREIKTFDELVSFLREFLLEDKRTLDIGRFLKDIEQIHISTKRAFINRLNNMRRSMSRFISERFSGDPNECGRKRIGRFSRIVDIKNGEIAVIHIAGCEADAQRIVVGSILSGIFSRAEREGAGRGKVLIFLDELSKYAPREGDSPIKSVLEDIAERGRSLGIILIGAQQSARSVSKKIILNSSIKVVGRMSPEEVNSSEYDFLSRETKLRLLVAKPGRMVIYQPEVYSPLPVRFPFPFWATRKEEVDESQKKHEIEDKIPMEDEWGSIS